MNHLNQQINRGRRGLTLIEAVISLVIVSVLMLGLSATVMLGSFAMPSSGELGEADREIHEIKSRIRDDLLIASSVTYVKSGNTTRLTLTLIPTGATGQGSSILYEFIGDTNMIRRRADAGAYEMLSTTMDNYRMSTESDADGIRYIQITLQFDSTIQQYFELFVRTPYRPELI